MSNRIMTTVEAFKDGDITKAKGERANVLVGIGWLGTMTTVLNPQSADEALKLYEEASGLPPSPEENVKILGFDAVLHTYDFDELD